MRMGTTPTHQFVLPFDVDMISAVEITYCQNRQVILQIDKDRCTMEENHISVTLTQEETFLFTADIMVEIQIRVLDNDGTSYSSDIINVTCRRCLSNEVLW